MSERNLTSAVKTHIDGPVVSPIVLAQLDFPTGTVRIWTGQGQISWNSQTWDGTGEAVNFSSFPETTDGSSQGVQIELTGIDSDIISDVTEDEFQGVDVNCWVGVVDSSGAVEADPYQFFAGLMDTGEVSDNGSTANIIINVESRLIDQLRTIQNRYTNEDQKKLYPGDKGLEFVHRIQDKQIIWKG